MSEFESYKKGPLTHLTPELMQAYLQGTLPHDLRLRVQAYLDENPFEAEAIEGLAAVQDNLTGDLQDLESRLNKKVAPPTGRSTRIWWRMAAVILLLALSGVVVYYFTPETSSGEELAVEQELVEDQPEPPASEPESAFGQTNESATLDAGDTGRSPSQEAEAQISKNRDRDETAPSPEVTIDKSSTLAESKIEEKLADDDLGSDAVLADAAAEVEYDTEEELEAVPAERSAVPQKVSGKSQPYKKDGYLNLGETAQIPYEFKVVVGKVTSYQTGSPVAGANVAIKGTDINTYSDQNGFFHFEAPLDAQSLVSTNAGFTSSEVTISAKAQIDVVMNENAPVSQATGNKAKEIRKKEPARKWSSEDEGAALSRTVTVLPQAQPPTDMARFLRENTQYPQRAEELGIEGDVVVSFTVLADGSLSDFKILKNLGFGCDEEAVKVLQNGPRWTPAELNGKTLPSQGQFSITFPPAAQ